MGTAEHTAAKTVNLVGMISVVYPDRVFLEVDDQFHRAIGQAAFPGVWRYVSFVQPDRLHKICQRGLQIVFTRECQYIPPMK